MRLRSIFLVVMIALLKGSVLGCMCGATSVSDAYEAANLVVIARVVRYEPVQTAQTVTLGDGTKKEISTNWQKVYLDISRWFKGSGKKTLMLVQPGTTCDWSFGDDNLKKDYLFYLGQNSETGNYAIISCGRSAEIKDADDDLSWLRGLPKSLKRTRISGRTFESGNGFSAIPSVTITLTNGLGKYDLTTNAKGLYEIWDLSPGKYHISAAVPDRFHLDWTTSVPDNWIFFWSAESDPKALDVTLNANECAGINFALERAESP